MCLTTNAVSDSERKREDGPRASTATRSDPIEPVADARTILPASAQKAQHNGKYVGLYLQVVFFKVELSGANCERGGLVLVCLEERVREEPELCKTSEHCPTTRRQGLGTGESSSLT